MTSKTHKAGGALCTVIGMQLLAKNNLNLEGINPIIQFLVIYPFALWGCTAPDLDHDWSVVADKNPVNYGINKILHIFNPVYDKHEAIKDLTGLGISKGKVRILKGLSARHRSWQTHSDLTVALILGLLYVVTRGIWLAKDMSGLDISILILIITGVLIGQLSHLILDMLTTKGVTSVLATAIKFAIMKVIGKTTKDAKVVKLRLVPKSEVFVTGGSYEDFVHKVVVVTTYFYIVALVVVRYINLDSLLSSVGG